MRSTGVRVALCAVSLGVASASYCYNHNPFRCSGNEHEYVENGRNSFNFLFDVSNTGGYAFVEGAQPLLRDLNGDSSLDLVVVNGTQVAYFEYLAGQFVEQSDPLSDHDTSIFAGLFDHEHPNNFVQPVMDIVDWDWDGDLDLIVGNFSGHISYFENEGNKTVANFTLRTGTANPFDGIVVDTGAAAPVAEDYDMDGDFDLVIGAGDGRLHLYVNNGTGWQYSDPEDTEAVFNSVSAGADARPHFVDVDNDGDKDLFVAAEGAMLYYENAAYLTWSGRTGSDHPLGAGTTYNGQISVTSGDVQGYLKPDIYVIMKEFVVVDYIIKIYNPIASEESQPIPLADGPFRSIATGQISTPFFGPLSLPDGNHDDLYVFSGSINDGDGTFDYKHDFYQYTENGYVENYNFTRVFDFLSGLNTEMPLAIADLNGDGLTDVLEAWTDAAAASLGDVHIYKIRWHRNNGDDTWTTFDDTSAATDNPWRDLSWQADPPRVYAGDYDNDADMDVIFQAGALTYYENLGAPDAASGDALNFSDETIGTSFLANYIGPWNQTLYRMAFGDWDGDGDLDYVAGYADGNLQFYRKTQVGFEAVTPGDGPFADVSVSSDAAPAFVDLDTDGDLDLVVGKTAGGLDLFGYGRCSAPSPCGGAGLCNIGLLSSCSCLAGYTGSQCEECSTGFYGPTCEVCPGGGSKDFLQLNNICNQRGTCDAGSHNATGHCTCNDPFNGDACDDGECPAGEQFNFDETAQIFECIDCSIGTSKPIPGNQFCTTCTAGRFANVSGLSECTLCPENYFIDQQGSTACIACGTGTFSNDDRTACDPCGPGTYADQDGCVTCEQGKVSVLGGSTACDTCAAGTYATSATQCTSCAAGTFKQNVSSLSCEDCEVGRYSNAGALTCQVCQSGEVPNAQKTGCVSCLGGTYSTPGDSNCTACAEGSAQPLDAQATCEPCARGKFQNETQATTCKKCPRGRYIASTGAEECELCPTGTFQSAEESQSCTACAAGRYQDITGSSDCIDCPAGYFCPAQSVAPIPCGTAALFCPASSSSPQAAGSGNYTTPMGAQSESNRTTQVVCEQGYACVGGERSVCPVGTVAPNPGATSCSPCGVCAVGKYQTTQCTHDGMQDTECLSCPPGRYENVTGQSQCRPCPRGSFCSEGAIQPQLCPAGSFQSSESSAACQLCPPNTYQPARGETTGCIACPAYSRTQGNGTFDATGCQCLFGAFIDPGDGSPQFCGCLEGRYLHPSYLDAAVAAGTTEAYDEVCRRCEDGMVCDSPGTTLDNLQVEDGWFRQRSGSPIVEECDMSDACVENGCAEGHEGPYCASCADGYYLEATSGMCKECNAVTSWVAFGLTVFFIVLIAGLVFMCMLWEALFAKREAKRAATRAYLDRLKQMEQDRHSSLDRMSTKRWSVRSSVKASPRSEEAREEKKRSEEKTGSEEKKGDEAGTPATPASGLHKQESVDEGNAEADNFVEAEGGGKAVKPVLDSFRDIKTKLKIFVAFIQMEQIAVLSFSLSLPQNFFNFLGYFSFLEFQVFTGTSGDCLWDADYFHGLVIATAFPLILMLLLWILKRIYKGNKLVTRRILYVLFLVTFFVLPTTTTLSCNTFLCEKLDTAEPPGIDDNDKSYLVQDYSIECYTDRHRLYQAYAAVMIVIYPVGIPTFYAMLLLRRPKRTGMSIQQAYAKLKEARTAHETSLLRGGHKEAVETEGLEKSMDILLSYARVDLLHDGARFTLRHHAHQAEEKRGATASEEDEDDETPDNPDNFVGRCNTMFKVMWRWGRSAKRMTLNVLDDVKRRLNLTVTDEFWNDGMTMGSPELQRAFFESAAEGLHMQFEGLRFLLENYEPEFWWFEILESFRRLSLTALPLFFPTGSVSQQVVGVLAAVVFMVIYLLTKPYVGDGDDALAALSQFIIFVVMVYGLTETASSGEISEVGEEQIGYILIAMHVVMLMTVVWAFLFLSRVIIKRAAELAKDEVSIEGIRKLRARVSVFLGHSVKPGSRGGAKGAARRGSVQDPPGKRRLSPPPPGNRASTGPAAPLHLSPEASGGGGTAICRSGSFNPMLKSSEAEVGSQELTRRTPNSVLKLGLHTHSTSESSVAPEKML
uniref:EGF-like domain-containing protein n=1 Tax=Phaeomonas parva TaxID=124430 RepID=A0A7S1UI10_9STRA|mmetsp:Transcript_6627/g.18847  ORF Transcript_6627/g.18847 Transcript_6627/m.18847 type:complete len:2099 (+) Transcript_6627:127-6423(+)